MFSKSVTSLVDDSNNNDDSYDDNSNKNKKQVRNSLKVLKSQPISSNNLLRQITVRHKSIPPSFQNKNNDELTAVSIVKAKAKPAAEVDLVLELIYLLI